MSVVMATKTPEKVELMTEKAVEMELPKVLNTFESPSKFSS
ncbi:hypothetical protein SDC9_178573 [bioreactor metagenome]|uniref:Uncharacterized protein n=1 Tax=bioreactor metagenome TaxID=1076179 RepID=A0A645GZD7_9ZZZZ